MNFKSALLVGFKEIWAHKFRSFLTMLGVILGVSSLVAMAALVDGMEKGATEALISIGGLKKIRIEAADVPPEQAYVADRAVGVTMKDVYALQNSAPLVTEVCPEMQLHWPTVSANGHRFRPFICAGTWPDILDMDEHTVQYGRMFNQLDNEMARSVCVIGTEVRDELFGSPEDTGKEIIPLGKTIRIDGQAFTIIGMFKRYESDRERRERAWAKAHPKKKQKGPKRNKGWSGGHGNFVYWLKNTSIFMPLNTAWVRFRSAVGANNSPDPTLTTLQVKIKSVSQMSQALQQMDNVLMSTHKGIEDFMFHTMEDWADNIKTFVHNARMSGGLIAGIALIVGGIGIMNIMLASITERVREIGIRKAVGANQRDIFLQILTESLVIAVLGGLVGLIASYGLVKFIGWLAPTSNAPIITVTAMTVAFAFSVVIGVLAGLFPAFKAARFDPISALRYE